MLSVTFLARLKPLAPDAKSATIKIQTLDLRSAPVHEHVERSIQGILIHRVARQRLQAVVGLPHVGRLAVQMHADLCLGEEHQPRATVNTTPPPSSSRTSRRDRPVPTAPISINGVAAFPTVRDGVFSPAMSPFN